MRILKRVIAVFIVVLTAFLLVPKGKAESNKLVPYGDKNDVFKYTDVNEFEDYTYTTDVLDNYKKAKYYKEDTKIAAIIPLKCFIQCGTHMHIGLKYGFFVQTRPYNEEYVENRNYCEVYVFKINRTISDNKQGVPYSAVTSITPVFCNDYDYNYLGDYNYKIISQWQTSDICINYFQNITTSKNINNTGEKRFDIKAICSNNIEEKELAVLRYGYRTCINVIGCVLHFGFDLEASITNLITDGLKSLYDIIVELAYADWKMTPEIELDITETITGAMSPLTSMTTIIDATVNLATIVIDTIKTLSSLSNFDLSTAGDLFDEVCEIISSKLTLDLIFDSDFDKEAAINQKIEALATVKLVADTAIDAVGLFVSFIKLMFCSYKTIDTTIENRNYYGYRDSCDLMVEANNNHQITTYSRFEIKPYNELSYDNYINFSTELYFHINYSSTSVSVSDLPWINKSFFGIKSTCKVQIYDTNKVTRAGTTKYILLNAPENYGDTINNNDAIITNGSDTRSAYFVPNFDGNYTINAITDNGESCPVSVYEVGCSTSSLSLKKGKTYEIRVNTKSIHGFHPLRIKIKGSELPSSYTRTKTFYCDIKGNYLIQLQASSDANFVITSVSYPQYIQGYGRTVDCNINYTKINNTQYKVSLEAGKTYKVVYSSKYDADVEFKMTDLYEKTTTYTCNKPGYYYFKINTSYSDVYYELTSVSYPQTYYFSSYHYTVYTQASKTKVSNKQYKVYLESGKTYSISYKCNYDVGLNIAYTQ